MRPVREMFCNSIVMGKWTILPKKYAGLGLFREENSHRVRQKKKDNKNEEQQQT
jgi:hypothetical protein